MSHASAIMRPLAMTLIGPPGCDNADHAQDLAERKAALASAGITVESLRLGSETLRKSRNGFPVRLFCMNPGDAVQALRHFQHLAQDGYNILAPHGPVFSEADMAALPRLFHEVWAGNGFVARHYADSTPLKVVQLPPYMGAAAPRHPLARSHFGIEDGTVLFLSFLDETQQYSVDDPLIAALGFLDAFRRRPSAKVALAVVRQRPIDDADREETTQIDDPLQGLAAADPRIVVVDRPLGVLERISLQATADIHLCLHRRLGHARRLGEALALAKPVIGVAWSGGRELLLGNHALALPYRLVETCDGCEAIIDPMGLGDAMTHLFDIPAEAEILARRAANLRDDLLSPQAHGRRAANRLRQILDGV